MTEYDIYLFDLDGTLLNTLDDLAAATNHALRAHALPERTTDEVRTFVGNGVAQLIARAVGGGADNTTKAAVLETFRDYYTAHATTHTRPYDGVEEMLLRLRSEGKRIGVVSNKFQVATEEVCCHFFGDLVDVAIGEREPEVRKKPAPDMVFAALRALDAKAGERAVLVGDADTDIATATAAAIPCISVTWGFRSEAFLRSHGATTIIHHPNEL